MTCALWLAACAVLLIALPGSNLARRLQTLADGGRLAAVRTTSSGGRAHQAPAPLPRRRRGTRGLAGWAPVGVAAVGAAGGAVLGGAVTAVLGVAVGASAAALGARALTTRSRTTRRDAAVRALRMAIGELHAGAAPAAALSAVAQTGGPFTQQFAATALALDRGGRPDRSWTAAGDLAGVGHAVVLAQRTGAPLASVLSTVAEDLAAARDQSRAAELALAGPKSSAVLMAALPMLGIGLGTAMGADPATFLLGSGAGRLVLCAGVVLDLLGVWWMAGLLTRARRT